MRETAEVAETLAAQRASMRVALHDLSQPLTALECRLHLGLMGAGGGVNEDAGDMRVSIEEAMTQCERVMTQVRVMQERLNETFRREKRPG